MIKSDDIIVSVVMITYGHENYIEQAINGVLMQECDFTYELIVANDCSPDNTDKIVRDIINNTEKASNIIRYYRHTPNKGMNPNFLWALRQAKGKYIALCEGDDLWIDAQKLQKQIEFLEANKDVSLLFHNVDVIENNKIKRLYTLEERYYNAREIYQTWTIPTCSTVFRKKDIENFSIPKEIYFSDIFLFLSLLRKGEAYCQNFIGGCYRRLSSGVSMQNNKETYERLYNQYKKMLFLFPEVWYVSIFRMYAQLAHMVKFDNSVKNRIKYQFFYIIKTTLRLIYKPFGVELK